MGRYARNMISLNSFTGCLESNLRFNSVCRQVAQVSYSQLQKDQCPPFRQSIFCISPFLQYYNIMNLFRSINTAVNQINAIGNYINNSNFNPNSDRINDLIRSCTYAQQVKFLIEKSVRQILHIYPQYNVDKIQFMEGNQFKKYIELKGDIQVENKGKILLFIMYPTNFPKSPPFIRIVNPNPQQLHPTQYYLNIKSKSDQKSYILNQKLQQIKNWKHNTSVASIIIEANDLVRTNYPFTMANQYPPQQLGWNYNNQGYINQNYSQSYGQNNYQQPPNFHPNNNNNCPKQPPIAFKTTANLNQITAKSQKLVATQKQHLNKMKTKHVAVLPVLQQLDMAKKSLQSESQILVVQNQSMNQFVDRSSLSQMRDLSQVVKPRDKVSQHILELNCSIKSREDVIQMLESRFNEQSISLQDFLKNIRKMQQAKFQEKVILSKYMHRG